MKFKEPFRSDKRFGIDDGSASVPGVRSCAVKLIVVEEMMERYPLKLILRIDITFSIDLILKNRYF